MKAYITSETLINHTGLVLAGDMKCLVVSVIQFSKALCSYWTRVTGATVPDVLIGRPCVTSCTVHSKPGPVPRAAGETFTSIFLAERFYLFLTPSDYTTSDYTAN